MYCNRNKAMLINIFTMLKIKLSELSEVTQSCPTLCDFMDGSLPGSSFHRIFQARILQWVASSFSRGFSWARDQTQVSHITARFFIMATFQGLTSELLKLECAYKLPGYLIKLFFWFSRSGEVMDSLHFTYS